ncbi:MAG TPA: hypothetical protein G4O00_13370 [Thermoflexia bacterium]|nr:hypothetical protein [Thermoflexia bacterium]
MVARRRRSFSRELNPMLVKELRGRMRGARAFMMLSVYLAMLGCFTSIVYALYFNLTSTPGGWGAVAYAGKVLFSTVVLLEIFLVAFITPAFTAGAISGERERKTYEILRTTLLPARRLVLGKLGAALAYVLLLILTAVPLESLAFMLGGVVAKELVLALAVLLVTAFAVAAISLFASALVRTTLVATVVAYSVVLLITVGMPLVLGLVAALGDPIISGYSSVQMSTTARIVLMYTFFSLLSLNPITASILTEVVLTEEQAIWLFRVPVGGRSIWVPSGWIVYTVVYLTVGIVLVALTIRRVRRQETR